MPEETAVVNDQVVQPTTTDSTPVETSVASTDSLAEADAEVSKTMLSGDDTESDESSDEPAEETDTSGTKPTGKAEDRKQQLNSEIRDLVQQRNTLRQQVEQINSQAYQPATEDQLLEQVNPETGDYYNRLEAKVAAMEQAQQVEKYTMQVAEAQLTLASEAQAALRDFPMFDSESPQYNPEIAARVDTLLGQNLIFDPNTRQVIGSNVSPYELYQTIADATQVAATTGQIKAQQATSKMQSRVDTTSNAAPKGDAKVDNFLKGLRGE